MVNRTRTFVVTGEDAHVRGVKVSIAHLERFARLCEEMRALLLEIQQDVPAAGLYLQESTPHLMLGPTHIGPRRAACPGNSAVSGAEWPRSGGGGW